jgi:putative ABC transport system substrate-binding protein
MIPKRLAPLLLFDRMARTFSAFLALSVCLPLLAQAQILRIGLLTPVPQPAREQLFHEELRRLGYDAGRNIAIEYRSADGRFERLPGLAAELVALKVDVIVARATQASRAGREQTSAIPSVMMRELLPKATRIAAVWNPANALFQSRRVAEAKSVVGKLGLELRLLEARSEEEIDRRFAEMARDRPQAVLLLADPLFGTHISRVAQLAAKHRLAAVYGAREFAEAGGLAAYGPSYSEAYRLAATYVDRIRKGSRPVELPVAQGARFELTLNAGAAKKLGIALPQSLVLRADEVIP